MALRGRPKGSTKKDKPAEVNTEPKRPVGRPKLFENSEAFKAAVLAYIEECQRDGVFPDEAGMRLKLRYSKSWEKKMTSETENPDDYLGYVEALELAKDYRESFLVRKMTSDNKAAQGCLNALKQPSNGGYIDRPVNSGSMEVTLKVAGIKGGLEAFG